MYPLVVLDINDNTPSFSEEQYEFSVAENTAQLSDFIVSANDSDSGMNGMIRYSIIGGNEEDTFILGRAVDTFGLIKLVYVPTISCFAEPIFA